MSRLRATLAGALSLERGAIRVGHRAFTGRQLPVLTIVMVLRRTRNVPVDELAVQLWPDAPPEHWRAALRGLVSRLRRILVELGYPDEVLVAASGSYRVELGDVEVDVEAVSHDLARARALLDDGRTEGARRLVSAARQVASRPVLAGIDAPILEGVRRSLHEQRLDALDLLAECRVRAGEHADAATAAREAVRLDAFREASWRHLMMAQAGAGNVAMALRGYEQMRRLLADQLGVDPSPQTQALHADLLRTTADARQVDAGATASTDSDDERVPYRGLLAFRPEDADLFFGRDVHVQELIDRLAPARAVAVTGPSGSGKSSVVRAGLLPALAAGALPESDTWTTILVTPGGDPLKALAAALADAGSVGDDPVGRLWVDDDALASLARSVLRSRRSAPMARLLVVVDQAEELFTICDDSARRRRFVSALLEATRGPDPLVRVALSMRSDFAPQAATVPELAELLSTSHYVLPPLDGDGYEAAIVGPARAVGVEPEPGLVGRILGDVTGEPGSLPLMQHALLELWDSRDGSRLTMEAYEAAGGVAGALAQRAEEVYRALDDGQQAVARRLLLRAVSPGRGTGDTRRTVPLAELRRDEAGADVVDMVVDRLVDARLLTSGIDAAGEPVVEVAHEALIGGWPRLAGWITDTREDLLLHERLAQATGEWVASERAEAFLLRGGRLVQHEAWTSPTTLQLAPVERELLTASRERADQQDRARRRRQRVTTITVGTAAVVALVLAGLAWNARGDAARERDVAEARRLLASSGEVGDTDPELALLLALEAAERLPGDPEASATLHRAMAANRTILSATWPDEDTNNTYVDLTDDGTTMAWAGQPGSIVEVRDLESGDPRWQHDFGHDEDLVVATRFISNDRELAVSVQYAPRDNSRAKEPPPDVVGVQVFDVGTGELVRTLPTSACGAWQAGAGVDWAAVVSDDGEDHLLYKQYSDAAIEESGCPQLGSVQATIDLVRLDVRTGDRDIVVEGAPTAPGQFMSALSHDGRVAAYDPFAGPRTVVEVESGQVLLELPEVPSGSPVALSPDGSLVAFASEEGGHRTAIHDVGTGDLVATTTGHAEETGLIMIRFSLDAQWLYTTANDGTARIWDVATGEELDRVGGFSAPAAEPRLSRDRTRLLTSTFSREIRVVNLTPGGRPEVDVPRVCGPDDAAGPRFHPSGAVVRGDRLLVHVNCDGAATPGRAKLVDLASGGVLSDVPALGADTAISDDATLLATQEWSVDGDEVPGGPVVVHESATGQRLARLDGLCTWDWAQLPTDTAEVFGLPDELPAALGPACRDAPEPPFPGYNQGMAISPDNRLVTAKVETSTGQWVVVSDVATGEVRAVLPGEEAVFVQDGRELIALELAGGRLTAYDTVDFSRLRVGSNPDTPFVAHMHHLPERAEILASSRRNGRARLFRFDVETLELVEEIPDVHEAYVTDLAVNLDAGLMVTGSGDGVARVWDLDTAELVHEVVQDDLLVSVDLADDGRTLYTTTPSGPVRGWLLDPDELLELARSRVTRDFTVAECARYFPDATCPEPAA